MNFNNKRYISKGVGSSVSPLLQLFMWHCIDALPPPRDHLQVFELSSTQNKIKIRHIQEQPEYSKEYLLIADAPVFVGKIFVIDDDSHSTMILANEY